MDLNVAKINMEDSSWIDKIIKEHQKSMEKYLFFSYFYRIK